MTRVFFWRDIASTLASRSQPACGSQQPVILQQVSAGKH